MRLYALDDVPLERASRIYRDVTWRAVGLVALIMTSLPMLIVWVNPHEDNNIALVAFTAVVALFFLTLFARRFIQARVKHNWLLAQVDEGLYVNFRHHHYLRGTGHSPGAVFIPRTEIAAVGKTLEKRRFEGRYSFERRFAYIDLYLNHEDTAVLKQALRDERRRMPARRDFICPVRLPMAGVVRVLWDRVHPPENTAVKLLSHDYPAVADRTVNYAKWEKLTREEKLVVVRDLWETGHVEEAVRLYRTVTGDDFHTSRAFFDRLAEEG